MAVSRSSVGRVVGTLGFRHRTGWRRRFDSREGKIEFCPLPSFLASSADHRAVGSRLVKREKSCGLIPWKRAVGSFHGGWGGGVGGKKPEAHNPSEGCRWKTAVKNNRRREALLNQPQKSLIPPEGDGAPCNPSSWEEESKIGSALWRETRCKN